MNQDRQHQEAFLKFECLMCSVCHTDGHSHAIDCGVDMALIWYRESQDLASIVVMQSTYLALLRKWWWVKLCSS